MNRLLAFVVLFIMLFPSPVVAQNSFDIDALVTYEVKEDGNTHVTNELTLTNLKSEVHAKEFSFTLNNLDVRNIKASERGKDLVVDIAESQNRFDVTVNFDTFIVGKGKIRSFVVEYDDASLASKTGEFWEISVPRLGLSETYDDYTVELVVPESFGNAAYISPNAVHTVKLDDRDIYTFGKDSLTQTGISAGFGQFQVFSFSLTYHLENPLTKSSVVQIALPPDTSTQRMYYVDISPEPSDLILDSDGNWMAEYKLSPRERLNIVAKGSVQIFAQPRPHLTVPPETLSENLKATKYWPVEDPKIKELAKSMETPEDVYLYVTDLLSYDYSRVSPTVERLGAVAAIENPTNAICMEYTDLFVSLARAAGIPAREINGYAYSQNPDLEPLSLVADVLHSWPEYWNKETKTWIPVDPTWGSTTGGVDYFNKLDLRHFAFVIHGSDDSKPFPPGSYKLGPNPQKDVYVSIGQLPQNPADDLEVVAKQSSHFPYLSRSLDVRIKNPGYRARYDINPKVIADGVILDSEYIEVLLPFGVYEFSTLLPGNLLGTDSPNSVGVEVGGIKLDVPTPSTIQVTVGLTLMLTIIIVLLIFIFYKMGKLSFLKRK